MESNIQKKVLQFESFINDVLKQDLAVLEKKLDEINSEIAEFLQLKSVINTIKNIGNKANGFKTKVDMGNNFFIQAEVENASHILLDIGLGYFVEFTLDEALVVIDIRIKLFERQVINLRKEIARTNAHIKVILIGIRDLQGLD
ncbi:PREDICTED: protein UXT homolog [Ceratosolen solmsi marchali]|uniref:Protein UXT homolog n=1 Tax=Ceratosolen solmsi marchali TaxID=326594 RepID=A0AAJ7DUD1_9HYME|nr:PREDICTED: protein UXT homolog [Ceratosolen solmsi marchali]XP_011496746.1 PREDICTED: protein UXT homolog [Ceratosolen solmsi marchali]